MWVMTADRPAPPPLPPTANQNSDTYTAVCLMDSVPKGDNEPSSFKYISTTTTNEMFCTGKI